MLVNFALHSGWKRRGPLRVALFAGLLAAGLAGAATAVSAQTANPTSATNPFYGSITAHPATPDVLPLSLDEAVRRGLENNLGLIQAEQGEKIYHGEVNEAIQLFMPSVTLEGSSGVYQHNLAALGFGPSVLDEFAKLFGFPSAGGISLITKDTLTDGRIHFSETVFARLHRGMEGCWSRVALGALRQNVGTRRSRAAGCLRLSACYRRRQRNR